MNKSPNALGKLALIGTLAAGPLAKDNAEAATIMTDTSERTSKLLAAPEPEVMSTTLLNFEATGDTFNIFGNFDGYSFTNNNDQPVVITSFNYQGMTFSGGLVGRSSASNANFAGPTTLVDMFGAPTAGPITIPVGETWTVVFEENTSSPFATINRAEGPVSGILDSGVPVNGTTSGGFAFRGQDQFSAGSINGYVIPEPSAALLVGLGVAGLLTRRRRKKEQDGE